MSSCFWGPLSSIKKLNEIIFVKPLEQCLKGDKSTIRVYNYYNTGNTKKRKSPQPDWEL